MKGKLVLIGGVSRCGKSTIAKELVKLLPAAIHLDQDDFVIQESLIPQIKDRTDWETPLSLDWQRLQKSIEQALSDHKYVIVEGIFAFSNIELINKADVKISLEASKPDFLKWRKEEVRWGVEPDWYLEHVWDAHLEHHNPHHIDFDLSTSYSTDLASQIAETIL